jgi:hypothetical protein
MSRYRPIGTPTPAPTVTLCSVSDCEAVHDARGYCRSHYMRWRRYGDPLGGPTPKPAPVPAVSR